MTKLVKKVLLLLGFLALSLLLTVVSVSYQRNTNEIISRGNLCAIENWMGCYQLGKGGGFPFAYLFDSPGVSVEYQLGFEDDFRWYPFVMNVWLYLVVLVISYSSLRKYFQEN